MRETVYRYFERFYAPTRLRPDPMIPRGLGAFYRYFVSQFTWPLGVMLGTACLVALINVMKPVALGWLIDTAMPMTPEAFLSGYKWHLIGLAVLFLVIGPLILAIDLMVEMQTLRPSIYSRIRHQIHWYLLRHSWSYFQRDFAGRIAAKSEQTTYALRDSALNLAGPVWYALVFLVVTLGALISADWRLAIPMFLWLGCLIAFLWVMMPYLAQASEAVAQARSDLNGRMVDSYTNIQTIKLFATQASEDAYAVASITATHEKNIQIARAITDVWLPLTLLNAASIVGTLGVGLFLWHSGAVTLGALAMALPLTIQITNMADWITQIISTIVEAIGTIRDGMKLIAQPHEITDTPGARRLVVRHGDIRFDGVTFAYDIHDGQSENESGPASFAGGAVIRDFDLHIRGGEKIGIIGRSGAGKSTLVNLLLRFFDVSDGAIRIDGQNIAGVTQESLRASIAMVTQDTSLLHRSVRENIRIGRPDASEDAMIAAARQAAADDFIAELRDWNGRKGYDAHAGERGVKLSGGQRQRIALARVILKDAPILILDEATSALDSEVEAAIQEQLGSIMKGKTAIVIAHRLSTIATLDRLVVMDHGRIIEAGTHDELIDRDGLYANLWRHQSGGFLNYTQKSA